MTCPTVSWSRAAQMLRLWTAHGADPHTPTPLPTRPGRRRRRCPRCLECTCARRRQRQPGSALLNVHGGLLSLASRCQGPHSSSQTPTCTSRFPTLPAASHSIQVRPTPGKRHLADSAGEQRRLSTLRACARLVCSPAGLLQVLLQSAHMHAAQLLSQCLITITVSMAA